MFPVSVEGEIDVPIDGADAALDRIKVAVETKGATSVERQSNKLSFTGKSFWGVSWNPLICFDRCEVSVHYEKIEYNCSTKIAFVMSTAMLALFWLAILSSRPKIPATVLVVFFAISLLWIVCSTYFVGRGKIRHFLSTAARGGEAG